MDKIQMTEAEFINLLRESASDTTGYPENYYYSYRITESVILRNAKRLGYIKKTDLEITKEKYNRLGLSNGWTIIYIEELEKEVDRLKGK